MNNMELSAGTAFFAALIIFFVGMLIICWIADIIQRWQDKRHPKQRKKPLSFNDHRFMR